MIGFKNVCLDCFDNIYIFILLDSNLIIKDRNSSIKWVTTIDKETIIETFSAFVDNAYIGCKVGLRRGIFSKIT